MGKFEKKRTEKKTFQPIPLSNNMLIGLVVVLLIVLIVLILSIVGKDNSVKPDNGTPSTQATTEAFTMKTLTVDSLEDSGDLVLVRTSYGTISYPYAFSDLVSVKAVNEKDKAALEFVANIEGVQYPLYTIWFNAEAQIDLGTLQITEGHPPVKVCAQLHDQPALEGGMLTSFHAAQETFNDVVGSLSELEHFTSAY